MGRGGSGRGRGSDICVRENDKPNVLCKEGRREIDLMWSVCTKKREGQKDVERRGFLPVKKNLSKCSI